MAKKRIPKGIKTIDVPLYHTVVHVAKTKEMFDELADYFGLQFDTFGYGGGVKWIQHETGYACAVCGFFTDDITHSTVAHEMLHATLFIADHVGVKRDDDEALCYLLGYLVDHTTKYLWPN